MRDFCSIPPTNLEEMRLKASYAIGWVPMFTETTTTKIKDHYISIIHSLSEVFCFQRKTFFFSSNDVVWLLAILLFVFLDYLKWRCMQMSYFWGLKHWWEITRNYCWKHTHKKTFNLVTSFLCWGENANTFF